MPQPSATLDAGCTMRSPRLWAALSLLLLTASCRLCAATRHGKTHAQTHSGGRDRRAHFPSRLMEVNASAGWQRVNHDSCTAARAHSGSLCLTCLHFCKWRVCTVAPCAKGKEFRGACWIFCKALCNFCDRVQSDVRTGNLTHSSPAPPPLPPPVSSSPSAAEILFTAALQIASQALKTPRAGQSA